MNKYMDNRMEWLIVFNGILTLAGYLLPNSVYNIQVYMNMICKQIIGK